MKEKSEWGWGCDPSVSLFLVMLQETVVAIVAEVELAFVAVPLSVPPVEVYVCASNTSTGHVVEWLTLCSAVSSGNGGV